jgi:predicted ATPase/class 3 adenylate cyclase
MRPDLDAELPVGTLTFVFSDIEGSTRLLRSLGRSYDALLATHDRIIREAAEAEGGRSFGSEGDAQHLVFTEVGAAVRAVLAAQRALASQAWPESATVRVRMGVHTGEVRRLGDDYVGLTLHETARIAAAGHGGQMLLSAASAELARGGLPDGTSLADLGEHRLKDLPHPVRLYQLAGAGLQATYPPLRTLEAVGARLPTQATSFVGRTEVEAVARLMASARLVTLTGPGGTGKTRLSIEVAAAVASRFDGGVFFVPLDTVTDPGLVASEIATVVGATGGTEEPLERLVAHLRDRAVLLVLDNLEQVVEARTTVSHLLSACPALSILATSRIPLSVYGEHEFPVPTLSLPPVGRVTATDVAASESVRLFVERAMAARPDFTLTDTNAPAVADIVARLDGLPLAIELAAARVRILPVEALRDRLDDRLGLLTSGARDLPERQRTLRGAIEWSHDLLDDPDRRLFARFAVMAGGANIEHAERVCGPAAELGREVFDGIDSLSQQSLLTLADEAGAPRCAMLVTIREYAAERLAASGEADLVARRHAEMYLALIEEAAPHLLGPEGQAWNDRVEREHDNLRAALHWIVRSDEGELGLRMIAAMWRFWQVRGHLLEGHELAHAVLDLPSVPGQDAALRSRAEAAGGGISYWLGRPDSTHRHYRAALAAAREAGDRKLLADALYDFGFAASPDTGTQLKRYKQGRPWFEESLALYRELDDRPGIASATWALSMALAADGDQGAAASMAEQSLELSRVLGDPFRTGWAAHLVGLVRIAMGEPDAAPPYLREALDIFRSTGDTSGTLLLLIDVAALADARGDRERQWRYAGAASRARDDTGANLVDELSTADFLGVTIRITPETDEERAWFEAGRAMTHEEAIRAAQEYLEGGSIA